MKWDYWICLFTATHCVARGLKPSTIALYKSVLQQFRGWVQTLTPDLGPDEVTACHALQYLEYLRRERHNGGAAINLQTTALKNFYRAIVAMGHLLPAANPMAHFPTIKAQPRKLPVVLSEEEVNRLLEAPPKDTVLGLRDRALLALLYGTGIRASECAGLMEEDVDLDQLTIRVTGKGGHQRVIPLNPCVGMAMRVYREQRRPIAARACFFQSREGHGMSRGAVYQRVRVYAVRVHIPKRVSPHRLRHTFATHLVKAGTRLVVIRDLLGHRCITSTQIYLHVTAQDLRQAAAGHPIQRLLSKVESLLPRMLPFQPPPPRRQCG